MKRANWLARCRERHYWTCSEVGGYSTCPQGHVIEQAQCLLPMTEGELVDEVISFVTGVDDE